MSTPDPVTTLQDAVAAHWPVGTVSRATPLQRGARLTVAFDTDAGPVVAKSSPVATALGLDRPSPDEIDRRLSLPGLLAGRPPALAPTLIRTRDGARCVVTPDGRCVHVLRRVSGRPAPDTPATWAALGRLAATAHAITTAPVPFGIPWDAAHAELRALAPSYPFGDAFRAAVEGLGSLPDGPTGLVHGELNPANAIRSPDGLVTVVDWDQAGHGPIVLDLGYPLLTAFVTTRLTVRHRSAAAFYAAWSDHALLPRADRPPAETIVTAAVLHALRYLGFADTAARWARVQHALAHRPALEALVARWLD